MTTSNSNAESTTTTTMGAAKAKPGMRRSIGWQVVANIIYTASQAVMLVLLGSLGDINDVGVFALGTAVTAPVFLLADVNLRVALAAEGDGRTHIGRYLQIRAVSTTLALIVCGLMVLLGLHIVVLAAAVSKAVESFSTLLYGIIEADGGAMRTGQSMVERSFSGLLFFAIGFVMTESVSIAFLGLAFGWLLEVTLRTLPAALATSTPDWAHVGAVPSIPSVARSAGPLGMAQFAYSVSSMIPRLVLERVAGTAALGAFATVAYLTQAVLPLAIALGVTILPRLSEHRARGEEAPFRHLLAKAATLITLACVVGAAGAVVIGPWVIETVFQVHASRTLIGLVFVSLAATLVQRIYARAIQAARRFKLFLAIDLVSLAVTVIVVFPLVDAFGEVGAAATLAIAYTSSLIVTKIRVGSVIHELFTTKEVKA